MGDILSQLQFFHLGTKSTTHRLKTLALDHITGQTAIAHHYCRFFCDILCQYPRKPPKCLVSDLSSGQDQYFQFPIKHLSRHQPVNMILTHSCFADHDPMLPTYYTMMPKNRCCPFLRWKVAEC